MEISHDDRVKDIGQSLAPPHTVGLHDYGESYLLGLMISAASTSAGPTNQEKKMGVMLALSSQAHLDDPGNSVLNMLAKP